MRQTGEKDGQKKGDMVAAGVSLLPNDKKMHLQHVVAVCVCVQNEHKEHGFDTTGGQTFDGREEKVEKCQNNE